MLCEVCKKQYAVTTRNINRGFGDQSVAVCNSCAIDIDSRGTKLDFIDSFWGNSRKLTSCGVCGTEIETILKTGYVGCATCYQIFGNEISDLVNSLQGRCLHVGKLPLSVSDKSDKESDVAGLMNRALETEDFNLAEIVRNHFPGKRR